MSLCNYWERKEVAVTLRWTFSANPLTMTAGLSTLKHLKENKSAIYPKINKIGTRIRKGLKKAFSEGGVDVDVKGIGSLFMTHFLNKDIRKISSALDVGLSDRDLLEIPFALIAKQNVLPS
jgi:glutamate-1-semialdehyde 2,1-aminomutase